MSNIRIKDLTTTAATTASDDFVAVDGTTNGTRKLNAYSPTFGGNATVGGTLTVSGETFTLANSTGAGTGYGFAKISGLNGGYVDFFAANGTTRNGSVGAETGGDMYLGTRTNKPIYFQVNWSTAATLDSTKLSIAATTASTTTSSGALVVGGGVGVAKSINAGESGSTHNFIGGDGGSGSTIVAIKDSSSSTKVIFEGGGDVQFLGTIKANASSNAFRISNSQTPASAAATGTAGTICWDTSYIYVCTATNTWKRVAIATW